MNCAPFTVTVPDVETALATLSKHSESYSVTPDGAKFSVRVAFSHVVGFVTVNGNAVTVHIEQRPLLVSCAAIEAYVRDMIANPHN